MFRTTIIIIIFALFILGGHYCHNDGTINMLTYMLGFRISFLAGGGFGSFEGSVRVLSGFDWGAGLGTRVLGMRF